MKVSIIIPAYNCEKFIEATIKSVNEQTYPRHLREVIIVNDGSTDQTKSILDRYKDEFKIIHTTNNGVSYARNHGLKFATGDFIQYLDSDDILLPHKIEQQVKALIDGNADVAYGIWQKFTETKSVITIIETIDKPIKGLPEIALFDKHWYPPAAILYTREIVDKIGGFKTWLPMVEDARFLLDAAINGAKFIYTPSIIALYRTGNSSSLSSINELKFVECCFKNALSIHEIWKNDYKKCEQKKSAVIICLAHCINIFSVRDKKLFTHAIDKLLEIEPGYLPENTGALRSLTKMLGYRNAERFARIKRLLFK